MHQYVAKVLKRLAESKEFTAATANKISPKRMLDRDFVNRFLAFYLLDYKSDSDYEGDLDLFMNKALDKLGEIKKSRGEVLEDIERRFKEAMKLSKAVFGEAAFCKKKDHRRINKALFEVISVTFAKLSDAQRAKILENKDAFKTDFYDAINENFSKSLASGTGKRPNIDLRYDIFNRLVENTLKP